MENIILFDPRLAVLCGMLFTTIVSATAEEPAAVPEVFQRLWRSYQIFQQAKKERPSGDSREKFWEIDMTKFEP
jgi:hypothetical protein